MQLDDPLGIGVSGVKNLPQRSRSRVQLFGYLPLQRVFLRFAVVHFSAWKFPVAGEMRALRGAARRGTCRPAR